MLAVFGCTFWFYWKITFQFKNDNIKSHIAHSWLRSEKVSHQVVVVFLNLSISFKVEIVRMQLYVLRLKKYADFSIESKVHCFSLSVSLFLLFNKKKEFVQIDPKSKKLLNFFDATNYYSLRTKNNMEAQLIRSQPVETSDQKSNSSWVKWIVQLNQGNRAIMALGVKNGKYVNDRHTCQQIFRDVQCVQCSILKIHLCSIDCFEFNICCTLCSHELLKETVTITKPKTKRSQLLCTCRRNAQTKQQQKQQINKTFPVHANTTFAAKKTLIKM